MKEIDWNLYAKVDVLSLYDLIHLSLNIHPDYPPKKIHELNAELDHQRTSRSIICAVAVKNGELKQHSYLKGQEFFSYVGKGKYVLVADFVQFAVKMGWELPEGFPVRKSHAPHRTEPCIFCHYSTKLIKAQEEAIRHFWSSYSPTNPETEPKKAVVIDWLKTNHAVSDNMAAAIATIIRPDGLNPGIKKLKKPSPR